MGKLTNEQLKSVKDRQGKINNILVEIGYLEARKAEFLGAHFEAAKALEEIKKDLKEQYGDITVNLIDGSFEKVETKETKTLEITK
jgi:hypothetical protein